MIARIAWFGALAALALITTFVQIDRQTATTSALASAVPGPLRSSAQAVVAARAIEGSDPALALEEAQRLVRRRPIPAENLTLLAVAQTKAGLIEEAGVTIQIAGQRGWREPVAQETVLRLALAAGDEAEAARRYAALFLKASTPDTLLQELGPAVLGEAGGAGQRTLIDIVSGTDRWNDTFLRRGMRVLPPSTFNEITGAAIKRGARFDCGVIAQTINALQRSDEQAAARLKIASEGQCP